MKILLLVHKDLVPPDKPKSKEEWSCAKWATEYDVKKACERLGFEVQVVGIEKDLVMFRKILDQFQPKIVFNLLEEFKGEALFDFHIVSYLEMLGIKYTGCNPRGLMLARDKALSKKILRYHEIRTPNFFSFKRKESLKIPKSIKYPLFVKSLNEDASLGITQESIVTDEKGLKERIDYFHDKIIADAIAETFIDGKEYYVSVVGNTRLKSFEPLELNLENLPDSAPKIATSKVKWDINYRKKYKVKTQIVKNIDEVLKKELCETSKQVFVALELSGPARIDFRMNERGELFVIEANPNPDLGMGDEFADSAKATGLEYDEVIENLIKLGLSWKSIESF